jgi:Ni/Co efflux regulator RcnB
MRKFLITLLLASAAASPALAGPDKWSDRQQAHEDRQQAREDRQQAREERQQTRDTAREDRSADRPQFTPHFDRPQTPMQTQSFNGGQNYQPNARANIDAYRAGRDSFVVNRDQRVIERQQEMRDRADLRQSNRPTPEVMRDRHPLVVSDVPRPGTQPPLRTESRRLEDIHWNRNWQNDARYDWRRYRNHHRSLFHLGFYYDPFGWGYQPYSIGWRMWPAYYGNQFWIDPGMYGLPYPPPGTRWVRYWNDALLVDTWSGEVIDVIPGFFW